MKALKFDKSQQLEFVPQLKARVQDYFAEQERRPSGNWQLYLKAVLMLALYVLPLLALFIFQPSHYVLILGLYFLMGLGMVGIGVSVMHDAVHASFSSKSWVNRLFAHSMELVGGSSFNWQVQHNVLHHSYTNISGWDEDISHKAILRLEPEEPWRAMHRYQHIYALPIYSLLTLSWIIWGDYQSLYRYSKKNLLLGKKPLAVWSKLIGFKLAYLFVQFILPIFILGIPALAVILGFVLMHLVAGFLLSSIFQLAHVVEGPDYPQADENGRLAKSWMAHQLATTANFSRGKAWISWCIGGLNYQIEHHLFPHISHVHYPKLAPIVQQTAAEFGLPYHEHPSFFKALQSHLRCLKSLGNQP